MSSEKKKTSGIGSEIAVNSIKSILNNVKIPSLKIIMQGVITAGTLNVRAIPTKNGEIVGKLKKNDIVSIFSNKNGWCQLKFNGEHAYVSAKYVAELKGIITAGTLNVRDKPGKDGAVVGKLKRDDKIGIIQQLSGWYNIRYKNQSAFVSSKYVKTVIDGDSPNKQTFLKDNKNLLLIKVEPKTQIKVPTSSREAKITAQVYNKFGGIIDRLSAEINIDVAAAVAVVAVESGGAGYSRNGKVLIRFENHLFYRFWGKRNEKIYADHFRFSKTAGWKGHLFRKKKSDEWATFHGNQNKEWEVLNFAMALSESEAIMSASYGLPQVIGSNYKRIGYDSPKEMLNNFEKNIRFHLLALFDFFTPEMKKNIRKKNFISFAADYNGRGQATRYGNIIKKYYNAFKK